MTHLFILIKKNSKELEEIQFQIRDIPDRVYYKIFGSESEKKEHLNLANEEMKSLLDQRQVLMESLILEANKELNRISQAQRQLILIKIT